MTERGLHFEDFVVGQTFHAGPLTLSVDDLKRFAVDNDPQYFHIDEQAATSSMFGGLIASGWQTAALSMRLLIMDHKIFAQAVVGAGVELDWVRPVRPGDSLNVVCEVLETIALRSRADRGMLRMKVTTRNQHGELLMTMIAKIVAPKRSGRL